MGSQSLLDKQYQVSPLFRLVEWNQLDLSEQQRLSGLCNEEEIYGVFLSCQNGPSSIHHIAERNASLLYLHLQQHHHLPHYFTHFHPEKSRRMLTQLVLDGILEIWWKGRFVHGSEAVEAVCTGQLPLLKNQAPDHISLLSIQAIRFAFELKNVSPAELAMQLYTFGTTPWDAVAKARFFEAGNDIHRFLLTGADPHLHQLLATGWWFYPSPSQSGWLSWERQRLTSAPLDTDEEACKLYISPAVEHLPAVFQKAVPILTNGAVQFKVGNSIEGVLRPDKMVAYFDSSKQLWKTAKQLEAELAGYKAHGVPFTSKVDKKGLLSWGIDPPEGETTQTGKASSWRMTITKLLAEAILLAQAANLSYESSFPFLQARLEASGIDMHRWLLYQEN